MCWREYYNRGRITITCRNTIKLPLPAVETEWGMGSSLMYQDKSLPH